MPFWRRPRPAFPETPAPPTPEPTPTPLFTLNGSPGGNQTIQVYYLRPKKGLGDRGYYYTKFRLHDQPWVQQASWSHTQLILRVIVAETPDGKGTDPDWVIGQISALVAAYKR